MQDLEWKAKENGCKWHENKAKVGNQIKMHNRVKQKGKMK